MSGKLPKSNRDIVPMGAPDMFFCEKSYTFLYLQTYSSCSFKPILKCILNHNKDSFFIWNKFIMIVSNFKFLPVIASSIERLPRDEVQ